MLNQTQIGLLAGNALPRERLLRLLDEPARRIVVRGPAGAGKSALLAQWATSRWDRQQIVWAEPEDSAADILRAIGQDCGGLATVIIDPAPPAGLARRLSALSPSTRILVSTRVTLCHITHECQTSAIGFEIGPPELLLQRGEFIAAVQCLAPQTPLITLQQLSASQHAGAAALAAAVLARAPLSSPADVRNATFQALFRTHVQGVLTGDELSLVATLATLDAVATRVAKAWSPAVDIETLFARLERAGLGAFEDSDRMRFRFAPVFVEMFRSVFDRTKLVGYRELARLSALDSLRRRDGRNALRSAMLAGDGYLATRIIRSHWTQFFGHADWRALDPFTSPNLELRVRFPILALAHAIWLQSSGDTSSAQPLFHAVLDRLASQGEDEEPIELLWILFARATANRNVGRPHAAADAARAGLALLSKPAMREATRSLASDFHLSFAEALFSIGDTDGARDAAARCIEAARDGQREAWAVCAAAWAIDGDIVHAGEALRKANAWHRTDRFARLGGYATFAKALIAASEGTTVRDLDDGAAAEGADKRMTAAATALRALSSGAPRAAIALVDEVMTFSTPSDSIMEFLLTLKMLAFLSVRDRARAERVLQALPPRSLTRSSLGSLTLCLDGMGMKAMQKSAAILRASPPDCWQRTLSELVFACSASSEGSTTVAADVAQVAWDRMSRTGNFLPFAILPTAAQSDVRGLLGDRATWSSLSLDLEAAAPVPELTRRELTVLAQLQAHSSLALIAENLHVSTNTVKTQLRSIYRKLGADKRSQALKRATEVGLLRRLHDRKSEYLTPDVERVSSAANELTKAPALPLTDLPRRRRPEPRYVTST